MADWHHAADGVLGCARAAVSVTGLLEHMRLQRHQRLVESIFNNRQHYRRLVSGPASASNQESGEKEAVSVKAIMAVSRVLAAGSGVNSSGHVASKHAVVTQRNNVLTAAPRSSRPAHVNCAASQACLTQRSTQCHRKDRQSGKMCGFQGTQQQGARDLQLRSVFCRGAGMIWTICSLSI